LSVFNKELLTYDHTRTLVQPDNTMPRYSAAGRWQRHKYIKYMWALDCKYTNNNREESFMVTQ